MAFVSFVDLGFTANHSDEVPNLWTRPITRAFRNKFTSVITYISFCVFSLIQPKGGSNNCKVYYYSNIAGKT